MANDRVYESSQGVPLEVFPRKGSTSRQVVNEQLGVASEEDDIGGQLVNVVSLEDVPPNGGYGWICTACVFIINAHTWGINAAWAIFLAHYLAHSTFPGATLFEYAVIGGLSISSSLLIAPVVNIVIRKTGTRITLILGALLLSIALLIAGSATEIWHLFLTQGFMFGFGMGFLYITSTAILPQWFSTRRSLAVGIASSGAGIGGLVYSLIAGRAVEAVGLQWTYRILGFCSLAANLISAFLIKDRNKAIKPQQIAFDYREFGRIEVILVIIWGFFTELGYVVLLFSLPHYAISIGLSSSQGAVVGAVLNIGLSVSRPFIGFLSDRWGRINVALVMTAYCGILCFALWIPAQNYAILLTFALFVGCGCGTFWGTSPSVTAEVVGLKRLPSAFSMICIALVLPATFAEPIGLQIVADSGYLSTQVFIGLVYISGAVSTWFLRSWKIREIEEKARAESADAVALLKRDPWLTFRIFFLMRRV